MQRRANVDATAAASALDEFVEAELAVRSLRDEADFCEGFHQLDQKLDFLLDRVEELFTKISTIQDQI